MRKLEKIQADVLLMNVDLLRIAEEISSENDTLDIEPEPEPVPAHQCAFARPLGSPCKTEGCTNTRQVTYRKRRKVAA